MNSKLLEQKTEKHEIQLNKSRVVVVVAIKNNYISDCDSRR